MLVAGARPNFPKIAPLWLAMRERPGAFEPILVHTGQHYDRQMSDVLWEDLGLPDPDYALGIGSGSHAYQTGRTMEAFEKVLQSDRPDLVVVVGDATPAMACAVTCAKEWMPVAHVEAGLRSRDRKMPEEINRIVTDTVSNLLLTTSREASANLKAEGVSDERIHFVGNVMIDSLRRLEPKADASDVLTRHGLEPKGYALVTIHRASNTDDDAVLVGLLTALDAVQKQVPVVFPVHPRTAKAVERIGRLPKLDGMTNLTRIEPTGYIDFLALQKNARLVLTDSGGIQEETTVFGVPCLTMRKNTERPETVEIGTNRLVGVDPDAIVKAVEDALAGSVVGEIPEFWDGHAAKRCVEVFLGSGRP